MTSEQLFEQMVLQRVIEAIKITLPNTEKMEEEEEELIEMLSPEANKKFDAYLDNRARHENDNQILSYERGLLDGLCLAHKAF